MNEQINFGTTDQYLEKEWKYFRRLEKSKYSPIPVILSIMAA